MTVLRIFVSSTYLDNRERRAEVRDAIEAFGHVPVMMERFTGRSQPTLEMCIDKLAGCQLFLGIIGAKYGDIPPGKELSFTELEWKKAVALEMPRLMFVIDPTLVTMDQVAGDAAGAELFVKRMKFCEAFAYESPATFTETSLGRLVYQALHEREPKGSQAPVTPRPQDALAQYRQSLKDIYGTIQLIGFKSLRMDLNLDELYVPLRALVESRAQRDAFLGDAEEAEALYGERGRDVELTLTDAFWRGEAWKGHRCFVLLGDPGSGKTTQLQRIALWVLDRGPESLGLPADTLPIFVPLRRLAEHEGDVFEEFLDEWIGELVPDHPAFARQALSGRALFLLDGLDEVSDPDERESVSRWIQQALQEDCFNNSRFVVSCRYAGYVPEVAIEEALEMHLRPLDPKQAANFIRKWYLLVETTGKKRTARQKKEAESQAESLIERISEPSFQAQRVSKLTRNPLLLTAICLVNKDRGQLPVRRAELYRECVDVLLEHWRAARKIPPTIGADDARRVLQPMALWLHEEDERTRATADELVPVLHPHLAPLEARGIKSAEGFLATIRDESGLLTGWDSDTYGFLHLGFQEYLAACEIRNRSINDPSVLESLAKRFGESWWREVGLLLVSLENPSVFGPYARCLVNSTKFGKSSIHVDELIDHAREPIPGPFLELLEKEGRTKLLWRRQLMAINVLQRIAPGALAPLKERLATHPFREIAARFSAGASVETTRSEKGDIERVAIPAGKFWMGSTAEERRRIADGDIRGWANEQEVPRHEVQLSAFSLSRCPVTIDQYAHFLAENPDVARPELPSGFDSADQPAVKVSWDDAAKFCEWVDGRLPTEAEWEYACRAETQTAWYTGDEPKDLLKAAWFDENSGGRTHPVGQKEPNAWGLHDMHGNVWEWCADRFGSYSTEAVVNPRGPRTGLVRVFRGGSFIMAADGLRSAFRKRDRSWFNFGFVGLRVAWPVPARQSSLDD